MRRSAPWLVLFAVCSVVFTLIGLAVGSVHVPLGDVIRALFGSSTPNDTSTIVLRIRLPEVITAATAGAGLAASGLIMQTLFRNPLAGPSVLGISSGASLGVAVVMLAASLIPALPLPQELLVLIASLGGAVAVLLIIVLADRRVGDGTTLLIIGLMIGYLCSAVVSVLQGASAAAALKGYVLWGMGSFAGVDMHRLLWLLLPVGIASLGAFTLMKPLDALLLGEDYAQSMGVNVARVRRTAIWITGVLAGTITAFCGPIAFLGLATPHVARAFLRTTNHRALMPGSMLLGAALALGCDILIRVAGSSTMIPLNAVTSLLGAPVVLWVLLRGRNWSNGH